MQIMNQYQYMKHEQNFMNIFMMKMIDKNTIITLTQPTQQGQAQEPLNM